MRDYGVMIYLLFDGQKFIRTCNTYEEAIDLANKTKLKDPYIKRVYDVDR